jgi:hypothetical protein
MIQRRSMSVMRSGEGQSRVMSPLVTARPNGRQRVGYVEERDETRQYLEIY